MAMWRRRTVATKELGDHSDAAATVRWCTRARAASIVNIIRIPAILGSRGVPASLNSRKDRALCSGASETGAIPPAGAGYGSHGEGHRSAYHVSASAGGRFGKEPAERRRSLFIGAPRHTSAHMTHAPLVEVFFRVLSSSAHFRTDLRARGRACLVVGESVVVTKTDVLRAKILDQRPVTPTMRQEKWQLGARHFHVCASLTRPDLLLGWRGRRRGEGIGESGTVDRLRGVFLQLLRRVR